MDTIEALLTRRSVRKFLNQPVDSQQVDLLLRAAMHAPSAGNEQPWHFIVINERALLDEIPRFHPYAQMLEQAPLAIVVCCDQDLEKFPDRWVQDCSAALQNILLAAHAQGLGAVWVGIHPDEGRARKLRGLLGLPPQVQPLALAAIGVPADPLPTVDRYKPERIHHNQW